MSNNWKEVVLSDLIEIKYGKDHKKLKEGSIPCMGTGGVMRYVEKAIYDKTSILLPRKGSLNNIYYIDKPFWTVDTLFWSKINENLSNPKFLFYVLSDVDLASLNVGSAVPSLTVSVLNDLKIKLPPLPTQKEIAKILGDLDAKIALNRKMNANLEAMAQALFQSWFVDFDPVIDNFLAANNNNIEALPEHLRTKGLLRLEVAKKNTLEINELFPDSFVFNEVLGKWIPEGWNNKKLSEIAEVKYGKDHKKLDQGEFPCYGSGGVMRYVDSTLYENHSVLIPRKGTLSNLMYVRSPFWSVDTMFYTTFEDPVLVKFLFYNLDKLNLSEMNVGSAVPSMTKAVLNDLNIIYPDLENIKKFDLELEDVYLKIESNKKQIESLAKLRDALLPQLISGKLSVPAAMLAVEEVVN
jgi:type I restriction enzyme S subunit